MLDRLICLAVGYVFGNFVTAEFVVRRRSGKHASEVGTGNPGMANVMQQFGFLPGIVVLLGDLMKTLAACLLSRYVLFPALGVTAAYYAGLGAALGHNYPFWMHFQGGKGVSVTCMAVVCCSPLWGFLSCLGGAAGVLLTKSLSLTGVIVPALFTIASFLLYGTEQGLVELAAALLMYIRFAADIRRHFQGGEKKTDIPAIIRSKLGSRKKEGTKRA